METDNNADTEDLASDVVANKETMLDDDNDDAPSPFEIMIDQADHAIINDDQEITMMQQQQEEEEDDADDAESTIAAAKGSSSSTHSSFPVARIRRIMKTVPQVRLISADAVMCMADAVELFIGEVALSSYKFAMKDRKKTISYKHVSQAVATEDHLTFLLGTIIPVEGSAITTQRQKADFFRRR
jgi:histone H3/H4